MNQSPSHEEQLTQISLLLRRLGVYRNYKGYSRLIYAVYLVMENENRLEAVVKEVYMPVAEKHNCSWSAVERCMRETISRIWVNNYEILCEISKSQLKNPPTPAEMLDIFATYLTMKI